MRVTKGIWKPGRVSVRYQWFKRVRGKAVAIRKANTARFTLGKALGGRKVRVRLVVRAPGHTSYTWTSAWSRKVRR